MHATPFVVLFLQLVTPAITLALQEERKRGGGGGRDGNKVVRLTPFCLLLRQSLTRLVSCESVGVCGGRGREREW